ncbi:fla cluster protein FlaD2 [Haloferax mediterranei ATCC 33500]|uniref:Fla cluster protein flaD n=1 Tax=Haloferax mediterranei (strain ATCC 33500 / DSM 1411 / JCM 8866 / NBRC 14739 / NCIMB 2177 / R-4) TaxID=523841 RepID=I3R3W3_HALMT|nr:FlaD/FlaE family flagellar protein [Haloferax mediterranei]AFK18923.1 fla cluster protein flaD [Haloferax mediterranei ATCC 33500]AHZ21714.1 fla cluster protein FlaD2 [Haloferax mediterranei ATCC 33500]EMA03218.1 fla cluster protein flaD [Haloferax mediterranei ATCC 33500]MDX5989016.1 FlaD/FlaE family flagellar protein [Haloferax mediterranei ATCC 33500]QCQ75409.1 fla cluster protein FlaD2 [Haloferax mediterranei ATCC 33500]
MPRDPRHYDFAERRRPADGRSDARFDWADEPTDRAWSDVARKRLLATTAAVTSDGQPFLETIPRTPHAEQILLDWCTHLVERLGGRGAMEMVSYYRDIGWIGDDPHDTIHERILSFTVPEDFENAPTEEDHIQSFSYIARLSAMHDSD